MAIPHKSTDLELYQIHDIMHIIGFIGIKCEKKNASRLSLQAHTFERLNESLHLLATFESHSYHLCCAMERSHSVARLAHYVLS